MPSKVLDITAGIVADQDPDTSYLDQEEFEDRKAQYERGDFSFVGVRVEAEVEINGVIQKISSGGLWGIESDSDKKHLREVAKEEYDQLVGILKSMGIKSVPSFKSVKLIDAT
jgi:hypothetical protein